MLKIIRYGAWAAVAVLAFFTLAVGLGWLVTDGPGRMQRERASGIPDIGGAFTMTNHRGETVTDRDIQGKPTLIFFGFTSCPEVCPTTLSDISGWLQDLGPDADRLNVLFVSVDPERDTVEQLANYVSLFDQRIVGLTGTPDQLAAMAKVYRVYYRKVPLEEGGYTMDHSAMVYMMDARGRFVGTIDYHEARELALPKLRRLLERS